MITPDFATLILPAADWENVAVWFLVAVLFVAGSVKLRQPIPVAIAMVNFGISHRVRPAAGRALGALEATLAMTLALGFFPNLTLAVVATLLGAFAAVIASALLRGRRFACGCFGSDQSPLSLWTLVRTLLLCLISVAALLQGGHGLTTTLADAQVQEATAGISILAAVLLIGRIGPLLRWNAIAHPAIRIRP